MRAKIILNEIKQNIEGSSLRTIGIGQTAMTRGYNEIKRLMGDSAHELDELTDIVNIKERRDQISYVMPHILKSLNCNESDLLFCKVSIFENLIRWKFLDETVFEGWRINDENYDPLTYEPDDVFNKGKKTEHTMRVECFTSAYWGISMIVFFRDFSTTYEMTGSTYFLIRYK